MILQKILAGIGLVAVIILILLFSGVITPGKENSVNDNSLSNSEMGGVCDNLMRYASSCIFDEFGRLDFDEIAEDCEADLIEKLKERGITRETYYEIIDICEVYWKSKIDSDEQVILNYLEKTGEIAEKTTEIVLRNTKVLEALVLENDYVNGSESALCPEIKDNLKGYKRFYDELLTLEVPDGFEKYAGYFELTTKNEYKIIEESYLSCIATNPEEGLKHAEAAGKYAALAQSYTVLLMQEYKKRNEEILAMYTD